MTQVNAIPYRPLPELSPASNQMLLQLISGVNTALGYNGEYPLKSPLNLNGHKITGVGTATENSDVLTLETGNNNYSASALRPQLEANGSYPLQSVRRMNDAQQREQNSSWLNSLLSTAPSANNIQVFFENATPSPGFTTFTIPASLFHFADGSAMQLNSAVFVVNNASTFNIAAPPTGAVSNGVTATITTTTAMGVPPGSFVDIEGVGNPAFDGTVQIATIAGLSFTFPTSIPATTSGGGTVTTSSVFYFYVVLGNPNPMVLGLPSTADSPFNRLPTSTDKRQLIAIGTVNASGAVSTSCVGGGTAGSTLNAGSFF